MLRALDVTGRVHGRSLSFRSAVLGAQRFAGRLSGVRELIRHGEASGLALHGCLYNLNELFSHSLPDSAFPMELLSIYLKEGMDFVRRLRGEFALAIWDGREETLHLATDRFRVYPIFYYHDEHKLVFASRLKAILAYPFPLKLTVNPEAIIDVVGSSMIPTPKTIFREIKKLPPGHSLTYHKGILRV